MDKLLKRLKKGQCLFMVLVLVISIFSGINVHKAEAAGNYPYLIKVNRKMCTVTVYAKDSKGNYTKPVKAMTCSPGWDTPLGTFKTPAKYRWHMLMGNVWGQYCTRITGGVLFHSVWYYDRNEATLSNVQFNNLGTVCSHGCVRLNVADVKWIYDNCPLGTTVTIYDSNDPGPLGKPETIKVSTASKMGYDPTDKWCSSNPYNKKKPVISGAKSQNVTYGSKVNVKAGVTAVNATGMGITNKIKTTITYNGKKVNKVNTKQPGKYKVTYKVTDQIGRKAQKTVVFKVQEDKTKPVIKGVKDQIIGAKTNLTKEIAIKGVTAKQGSSEVDQDKIKVEIAKKSKYYIVTYSVTAKNGKTVKEKAKFTIDSKAPVFKGVKNREIAEDAVMNKTLALKGVSVSDDHTKQSALKINVSIKDNKDNTYTVTYTCEDQYENLAKKTVTFTRKIKTVSSLRIEGAKDLKIVTGTAIDSVTEAAIDLEFAKKNGIKAYDGPKDITNKIKIETKMLENGVFEVTYSVSNDKGEKASVKVVYTFMKKEEEHPGVG